MCFQKREIVIPDFSEISYSNGSRQRTYILFWTVKLGGSLNI